MSRSVERLEDPAHRRGSDSTEFVAATSGLLQGARAPLDGACMHACMGARLLSSTLAPINVPSDVTTFGHTYRPSPPRRRPGVGRRGDVIDTAAGSGWDSFGGIVSRNSALSKGLGAESHHSGAGRQIREWLHGSGSRGASGAAVFAAAATPHQVSCSSSTR